MRKFKRALSLLLVLSICFSMMSFGSMDAMAETTPSISEENVSANTVGVPETAFALDISAPETATAGEAINVVITIKNITKELDAVAFYLDFDETKLSPVITEKGSKMDAFMTVVPMYTMVVNGTEIQNRRYEQITKYDAAKGVYECKFIDLLDYTQAKEGETYKGLINDGDLVVTIPFVVKDTVSVNDKFTFSMVEGETSGTTRHGINGVLGTADTATTTVVEETKTYEIIFVDEDGTVLSSKIYNEGDTVVPPSAPVKAADKIYTYTFAGWDKNVTVANANVTYKATYTSNYINYTVKFVNDDGTVISTKNYHYGDAVTIPSAPVKAADKTYTYTFAGWDKTVTAVTGDATYKATFTSNYINYTVKFVNEDGTVISTKTYHYGDTVTTPANPTKSADKTYTYTFAGWDKTVSKVTGDATYKATYTSNYINYTIKFVNDDGTVISTKTYHYGDAVTAPANPTKASDNTYTYTFAGWDKTVTAVTGNATYKATYTSNYINYTVKFVNEDGTVISTKTYHYGDTVTVPANPTKSADKTYTYTFKNWDKTVSKVTGDATYTATYNANYINYTVKFVNEDGTVISTKTYHYGDTVTVPSNPTKAADKTYTYTFAGWDKTVAAVTGNVTYKATFTANYINYTVEFVNEDGTVISTKTYHYGDTVTVPTNPTRANDKIYGYTFSHWDKEISKVTSDAVYTAKYNYYCACFTSDEEYYLDVENEYMPNIDAKTTVAEIVGAFAEKNIAVTLKDANGNSMSSDEFVGTGCTITEEYGNQYTVILLGDVDGNGLIDATDYLRIKSMFLKKYIVEGVYFIAADVEPNGVISSTDYLQIKSHFLGILNIHD